jgi:hypothetical protein
MFYVLKQFRARLGYGQYSAETIDRLIRSKHVEDLRWVVVVTMIAAILAVAVIAAIALAADKGAIPGRSKIYELLLSFQLGAVLATVGAVFAWCYKTGSSRLGIVDLFSCEITTLCRICTINGVANTCISAFELDSRDFAEIVQRFRHFESEEAYTPIFDSNAKELQSLSVKVVINITAFYTYWKATRDAFRRLAQTPAPKAPTDPKRVAWQGALRRVIYMHFLTLESARKAVRDLIEFEPNRAENTITILLSELPTFAFLLRHFDRDDVRHARLKLRLDRYRELVPKLYDQTKREHEAYRDIVAATTRFPGRDDLDELCRDWNKAYRMLDELKHRYEAATGEALVGSAPASPPPPSSSDLTDAALIAGSVAAPLTAA